MILDLSAGNRGVWFDKDRRDVLHLDIRAQVCPSVVADTRMLPLPTGANFGLVVFDPPHVNFGQSTTHRLADYYGRFTTETIRDTIHKTAAEAWRVSAPRALMAFKWNDHSQKLDRVLALMSKWWEPLFGHKTASKTKHSSSTTWTMLRRKDNAE